MRRFIAVVTLPGITRNLLTPRFHLEGIQFLDNKIALSIMSEDRLEYISTYSNMKEVEYRFKRNGGDCTIEWLD